MRVKRMLGSLAAIVAALCAVATAGASVERAGTARPDFSTDAGVQRYLASLGLEPRGVVIQRGARNYAGQSCPGTGWNCSTSSRVVQVAGRAGENRFECVDGSGSDDPAAQECTIMQAGPDNLARCVERSTAEPDADQRCIITQEGDRNEASVEQTIAQTESPAQNARQFVFAEQLTGSGRNTFDLRQRIDQSTKTGTSQTQDTNQQADIEQVAETGDNASSVDQSQDLEATATGGPVSQLQNAAFGEFNDCAGGYPFSPNVCAFVLQATESGANESELAQRETLDAKVKQPSGGGVQQQGFLDTPTLPDGGIEAEVDQLTTSGQSHSDADQDQRQTLPRNLVGVTQEQYGKPTFGSTFLGEPAVSTFDQRSTQRAGDDAQQIDANILNCDAPDGRCDGRSMLDQSGARSTFTCRNEISCHAVEYCTNQTCQPVCTPDPANPLACCPPDCSFAAALAPRRFTRVALGLALPGLAARSAAVR